MKHNDFYTILGARKDANEQQLKKAYRREAMKYHPDRNQDNKVAEEKFKAAAEAYEVLSNSDKRARYDRIGHQAYTSSGGGEWQRTAAEKQERDTAYQKAQQQNTYQYNSQHTYRSRRTRERSSQKIYSTLQDMLNEVAAEQIAIRNLRYAIGFLVLVFFIKIGTSGSLNSRAATGMHQTETLSYTEILAEKEQLAEKFLMFINALKKYDTSYNGYIEYDYLHEFRYDYTETASHIQIHWMMDQDSHGDYIYDKGSYQSDGNVGEVYNTYGVTVQQIKDMDMLIEYIIRKHRE